MFSQADLDALLSQRDSSLANRSKQVLRPVSNAMDAARASVARNPQSYTTDYSPGNGTAATAPKSSDFLSHLGKGMLGMGGSTWDAITTGLDYLAKPVQTAEVYPANAITALRNWGTGKTSNPFSDFTNMTSNDVHNIWNQKDSPVAQQAIDRWAQADPTKPWSPGHWIDPAAQLLSGSAEGKVLSAVGKLGMEGLGRIPGISGAMDRYAAGKAGTAFDASQAAKAPEVDPFASTVPNPNTVPSASTAVGDWTQGVGSAHDATVPHVAEGNWSYQPSGFQHEPLPLQPTSPATVDSGASRAFGEPTPTIPLQPTSPSLIHSDAPESFWTQGAGSSRSAANRNTVEGQFSNAQDPLNINESSVPLDPRQTHVDQIMRQMSPGEKLGDFVHDKVGQPIQDKVSEAMFKMGIGSGIKRLSDGVRNAILNNRAKLDNMDTAVNQHSINLAKAAKDQGLTLADLKTARNQYETGQPITNDKARGLFDQLAKSTSEGIDGAHVGLNAEKGLGIAPDTLIDNYIHLSTERPNMFSILGGVGKDAKSPVTRGYANERYFKTADTAEAAGYKVRDPIASTADRLKESNKDLRNVEMHNELAGMSGKTKEISDIPTSDATERFKSAYNGSGLNGKYVSPELNSYLKGLERTPVNQTDTVMGSLARGLDRAHGLYRKLNMYNPLVHSHNIIGNALMAFGLHPKHYADAEHLMGNSAIGKALGGGENAAMKESLDEANRTGALGAQHSDVFHQIKNTLDPTIMGNIKQGHANFQDAALWNRERAMRLGVFHQARQEALGRGLKAEDAANVARDITNKHLIDYSTNNLSSTEKELWSRLDPFYKWHKGNYPLQFSKLSDAKAMSKVNAVRDVTDNVNQMTSGHHQADNSGGPNQKNNNIESANGTSYDPYLPFGEVNKVLNGRIGEFAWNRLSPYIKEPIQQLTNHAYAPVQSMQSDGHDYRAAKTMTNPSDNLLQELWTRLGHAGNTLAPQILQNLKGATTYDPTSYKANPLARIGLGATGGFVNPNLQTPQSDAMQQKAQLSFMQRAMKQKLRGN